MNMTLRAGSTTKMVPLNKKVKIIKHRYFQVGNHKYEPANGNVQHEKKYAKSKVEVETGTPNELESWTYTFYFSDLLCKALL